MIGIGGIKRVVGSSPIQVPFPAMGVEIEVDVILIYGKVPSLLSMKSMVENGLEISIQDKTIRWRGRFQPLNFRNYFLIHVWLPADFPNEMYTEDALIRIHRNCGNTSVRATQGLLRREKGSELRQDTRREIYQIVDYCGT